MVPDVHRRECRTRREESRARFGLVSRDIELVAVERRMVDVSRGVANVRPPFSFDEADDVTRLACSSSSRAARRRRKKKTSQHHRLVR